MVLVWAARKPPPGLREDLMAMHTNANSDPCPKLSMSLSIAAESYANPPFGVLLE